MVRSVPLQMELPRPGQKYDGALLERLADGLRQAECVQLSAAAPPGSKASLEALQELLGVLKTRGLTVEGQWITESVDLSPEDCSFLAASGLSVGLLLDGPEEIHQKSRQWQGLPEEPVAPVLEMARQLRACGVPVFARISVTPPVAQAPETVYGFLTEQGFLAQEYLPPSSTEDVTPEVYGTFLIELFSRWWQDRMAGETIHIREFENLAGALKGTAVNGCGAGGGCWNQNAVALDGTVYLCQRDREQRRHASATVWAPESGGMDFLPHWEGVPFSIPAACRSCRWVSLCQGGCRCQRPRVQQETVFCDALKRYYDYAVPRMLQLLRELGKSHPCWKTSACPQCV